MKRRVLEGRERTLGKDAKATYTAREQLAMTLIEQGRLDEAQALYNESSVADHLDIEQWLQGEIDLASGKPTVLTFFETWCPYSQTAMPKLERVHQQYGDDGIQVVGVTQMTKTSTEDKVRRFIQDKELTYPVCREGGEASRRYNPRGDTPATVVIRDGKLLWYGHPQRLSDAMLSSLIADDRGQDPANSASESD